MLAPVCTENHSLFGNREVRLLLRYLAEAWRPLFMNFPASLQGADRIRPSVLFERRERNECSQGHRRQ